MFIRYLAVVVCLLVASCADSGGGGTGGGGTGGGGTGGSGGGTQVTQAELTFMGVTQWLLQYGETTVFLDAYFSRPADGTEGSTEEGLDLMQRALDAAGAESVDFILVGHSHFDHAVDCGAVAMRTGAQVIGSQTTCLIAQSAGLPEERCTVVGTGDELTLGEATVRAVRTIHFAPESLGSFTELEEVPSPEDSWRAPAGGPISYLISFPGDDPFSLFYTNSIAPIDGDDGSGEDYTANLDAAFSGVDGVTAWLGPVGFLRTERDLTAYFSRIQPEFVLPQHFDPLDADIEADPMAPFTPEEALLQVTADQGTTIIAPQQYFDVLTVTPNAVTR
jgi:L-ascorbate metabolism protein UlaG (beta-lactamase superfamily)